MPEHGGNLDLAEQRFGGRVGGLDRSVDRDQSAALIRSVEIEPHHWSALPSRSEIESLHQAAQHAYAHACADRRDGWRAGRHSTAAASCAARPGAHPRTDLQRIRRGSVGRGLGSSKRLPISMRWRGRISPWSSIPTIPTGGRHEPKDLLALLPRVGRLVIDESFADAVPELSLAPEAGRPGLLILRSFGKFYGLAGVRLGFALGSDEDIAALAAMSGPWPVSGCSDCDRTTRLARSTIGQRRHRARPRTRLRPARRHGASRKAGSSSAARRCFVSTRPATRLPRRSDSRVAISGRASSPKAGMAAAGLAGRRSRMGAPGGGDVALTRNAHRARASRPSTSRCASM